MVIIILLKLCQENVFYHVHWDYTELMEIELAYHAFQAVLDSNFEII